MKSSAAFGGSTFLRDFDINYEKLKQKTSVKLVEVALTYELPETLDLNRYSVLRRDGIVRYVLDESQNRMVLIKAMPDEQRTNVMKNSAVVGTNNRLHDVPFSFGGTETQELPIELGYRASTAQSLMMAEEFSYSHPEVVVQSVDGPRVELTIDGSERQVAASSKDTIKLPERNIEAHRFSETYTEKPDPRAPGETMKSHEFEGVETVPVVPVVHVWNEAKVPVYTP